MKQNNKIKVNIDKENNLIVSMKITAIKPIIETLKKYKNEDITEDIKDMEDMSTYLSNLLIKNDPYVIKNFINEIIDVYETELLAIIETNKYDADETIQTSETDDIDDMLLDLPPFEDIELNNY